MTEEEAKAILSAHGWTWHIRKRRKGTPYLYAARKEKRKRKVIERYIAPLSRLEQLTQEELIDKLTR